MSLADFTAQCHEVLVRLQSRGKPRPDQEEMNRALQLLWHGTRSIKELRVIRKGRKVIDSGYFDYEHTPIMAAMAAARNLTGAVYTTLNPVNPALQARGFNRVADAVQYTAGDADITGRVWLLVDVDPVRPAGISATDAELGAAIDVAWRVYDFLANQGWPDPVIALSGNGVHLFYGVDLPNTSEVTAACKGWLMHLAERFNTPAATVDKGVFNASRIVKIPGSVSNKGDSTLDRPHRLSGLIHVPTEITIVTMEQLQVLLSATMPDPPPRHSTSSYSGQSFDIYGFLDRLAIRYTELPYQGGTIYKLDHCPFNPDHGKGEASIIVREAGILCFKCMHDSCSDKHWRDLRDLVDGIRHTKPYIFVSRGDDGEGTVSEIPAKFTDMRVSEFFVRQYSGDIFYCPEFGKWLVYDGKRFTTDAPGGVYPLLKQSIDALYPEVRKIEDEEQRAAALKNLIRLESHRVQQNILAAAEHIPVVIINSNLLDQHHHLLNVNNGTIDLTTGTLRPYSRDDRLTRVVPIDYHDDAACPVFLKFLNQIMMGDAELVNYLQRWIGYCLTGYTTEQVLLFFYGLGANGKSTLAAIMARLIGDYCSTAGSSFLMQQDNRGGNSNDLAAVRGARVVQVSEFDDGERLAEAQIKTLTGGDRIACRYLYGEYFEYTPSFKINLIGNYKPKIRGRDAGIWRRIHLLHFKYTVPPEERDPRLMDKLIAELPGILRWAVQGCLAWKQSGLMPPNAVKEETDLYRRGEDTFQQWLDDCCEIGAGCQATAGALLESFKDFSGWRHLTSTKMGKLLDEKGFDRYSNGTARYWLGLDLMKS